MKATELRIGNYYNSHGAFKKATPNTIEELFESENRTWIQPIPLTEEILSKCGFKNYENECSWIKQGIKIFEDENGHYIFFDHDIHLNSLHQLQNLYFALTDQELEINL